MPTGENEANPFAISQFFGAGTQATPIGRIGEVSEMHPGEFFLAWVVLIAASPSASGEKETPPIVVVLGDSITKGVREGVAANETFSHLLEERLNAGRIKGKVINRGIGGETASGGLQRLEKDVLSARPAVVAIMYGTNDCWVDAGKKESRVSIAEYRRNLEQLVRRVRTAGVKPILMTEPCYAKNSPANGLGEHGNVRLAQYMIVCREVAASEKVPLVDHFERWQKALAAGTNLSDWTTDGYHPNPRGHKEIAEAMLATVPKTLPSPKSSQ